MFLMPVFNRDAANAGSVESIKFLVKKGFPWSPSTTLGAAASNHVEVLQYAHDEHLPMRLSSCTNMQTIKRFAHSASDVPECIEDAAARGDFPRFKFWMDLNKIQQADRNYDDEEDGDDAQTLGRIRIEQYGPRKDTAIWAAKGGNIDCLRYALEERQVDAVCKYTEIGSAECFKYLVETVHNKKVAFKADQIYWNAIRKRQRDVIEYAMKVGLQMSKGAGLRAAETGDFEFFKWAVEEMKFDCSAVTDDGSESEEEDEDIFVCAISGGNLDILKYCFEKKLPRLRTIPDLVKEAMDLAHIKKNHFKLIEYLWAVQDDKTSDIMTPDLIRTISPSCSIETLNFLIQKGVKLTVKYATNCATADKFEQFAFMVQHLGPIIPIGESFCYRLEMAKYAYDHRCKDLESIFSSCVQKMSNFCWPRIFLALSKFRV